MFVRKFKKSQHVLLVTLIASRCRMYDRPKETDRHAC